MILLGRMAAIGIVIGVSLSVAATERIDVWLAVGGALGWSFVPILQLFTGLLLVRGATIGTVKALEDYFGTHWPWSLWIIAFHATLLTIPVAGDVAWWLLLTAILPAAVTVRLLLTLCREVLFLPSAVARRRVILHQAATLLIALVYIELAVALWPRGAGWFS